MSILSENTEHEHTAAAPQTPEDQAKKDRRQQYLDEGVKEINEKIGAWNARFQRDALDQAAERPRRIMALVDKVNATEPRFREIVEGMDLKAKATFCALTRLQALDGQSIGLDFGAKIMDVFMNDDETVEEALEELPDDPDVQFLSKANSLANLIYDLCEGRAVEESDIESDELASVNAPESLLADPATEAPEPRDEEVTEEGGVTLPQASEDEECAIPSTGIPTMDFYLDRLDAGKLAMVFTMRQTFWFNDLYDKVQSRVLYRLNRIEALEGIDRIFAGDPEGRAEFSFWRGFEAAAVRAEGEL